MHARVCNGRRFPLRQLRGARAEGAGIQIYDGIFTRVVRILVLTVGLVANVLTPVLWVLAVMTIATTFHRLYAVWLKFKELDGRPALSGARPGGPARPADQ